MIPGSETAFLATSGLILAIYVGIGLYDFMHLRIRNKVVLLLIALYPLFALSLGGKTLVPDIGAGLLLFALGFAFWFFGLAGAGDAKLAAPIGLYCSLPGLLPYIILLFITSVLLLIVVRLARNLRPGSGRLRNRLHEIAAGGKVPYSLPMIAAGGGTLILRMIYTIS